MAYTCSTLLPHNTRFCIFHAHKQSSLQDAPVMQQHTHSTVKQHAHSMHLKRAKQGCACAAGRDGGLREHMGPVYGPSKSRCCVVEQQSMHAHDTPRSVQHPLQSCIHCTADAPLLLSRVLPAAAAVLYALTWQHRTAAAAAAVDEQSASISTL